MLAVIVMWATLGGETVSDPAAAQARVAEALADADAIDAVTTQDNVVSFAIDHVGERIAIDVTTSGGVVTSVAIHDRGAEPREVAHAYDWLAREAAGMTAVHALTVGDDGEVTLGTDDGRRYLLIPDRHDGNTPVEARWGAEWDNT